MIILFSDATRWKLRAYNSFIPKDNTAYELTVIYETKTYKGSRVKKSIPIYNKTFQGTGNAFFFGKETELKVSFLMLLVKKLLFLV
jgi:hypothetical protein